MISTKRKLPEELQNGIVILVGEAVILHVLIIYSRTARNWKKMMQF